MPKHLCKKHQAVILTVVEKGHWSDFAATLTEDQQRWAQAHNFTAKPDQRCILPNKDGGIERILLGAKEQVWDLGGYASQLPPGHYQFDDTLDAKELSWVAMSWALDQYKFDRYLQDKEHLPRVLVVGEAIELDDVQHSIECTNWVRDLINTPTNDMGPEQLAKEAQDLAKAHEAQYRTIVGEELNKQGFPAIYQVGQASSQAPRLIELDWVGDSQGPTLTLVGKGVCFDTGGLDIKTAAGMLSMKKDMGGAAHALGLAKKIMLSKLPLRLKVLIPAVENSIAGNAYRPSDVITMRDGSTVEVTNTDAEGRLVLADAISYACEQKPDLLIDFATLTGAARIALGTEIVAMFSNQKVLNQEVVELGEQSFDPVWAMPLYQRYRKNLDTRIASRCNAAKTGYGGAITAALFLQDFVTANTPWVHCDLMASNSRRSPGRPLGGEAMGLRAIYQSLLAWLDGGIVLNS